MGSLTASDAPRKDLWLLQDHFQEDDQGQVKVKIDQDELARYGKSILQSIFLYGETFSAV